MKGLVIWAQSSCRSQMGFYRSLGEELCVPVVVPVWFYKKTSDYVDNRGRIGFCDEDEFSDMTVIPVGENWAAGQAVLDGHPGWTHLFCNYQNSPNFRRLQMEAYRRGEKTAIGSEAPCNMFTGWRKVAKEIYYRTKLRNDVASVIAASEFFVNYSGNDCVNARVIGWPNEKIIPLGYFPPPIPGTHCVKRRTNKPFEILTTGEVTWHRGSDVLIEALSILKRKGVSYHATITQNGPLAAGLKNRALQENLPIDFTGFLPLDELHRAYETCTVYVGAGRREPWGMRLNDALNCGAPLIVSRGMGGVKIVDDYRCGLSFANADATDLAEQLMRLATDEHLYRKCADNVLFAAEGCSPQNQAKKLVSDLKERGVAWLV